jgi:hypothetical protein
MQKPGACIHCLIHPAVAMRTQTNFAVMIPVNAIELLTCKAQARRSNFVLFEDVENHDMELSGKV